MPILVSNLTMSISFIFSPTLPSSQPNINFWSQFDYWVITFAIAFVVLSFSLWKIYYIERALFLSAGFYIGLFTQSVIGIWNGSSLIIPSYSLTMFMSSITMGLIFLKGRD